MRIHRVASRHNHPISIDTIPNVIQDVCIRYTVASRDIPACQLILREAPAVHGPYTKTTPVCLSCYAKVGLPIHFFHFIARDFLMLVLIFIGGGWGGGQGGW